MFELVGEVVGHQGDVRSVCSLGSMFVSGSRDRFGKIWVPINGGRAYEELRSLFEHEHWVSAVFAMPDGLGFATGSQDKKIRWYDNNGGLMAVITGHEGPVASLGWTSDGLLISGSWDGTARTWRLDPGTKTATCTGVLKGHENGVCVLGLKNGDIVTGSAGVQEGNRVVGFQLRIWRNGQVVQTMKQHQGAIRSLCMASKDGNVFASTSNDGTVKLWSSETGDLMNSMSNPPGPEGGPAFNFFVAPLDDHSMLAVASDDCCARIWDIDRGIIVEEIPHPCTVWCVDQLENGDVITGGSDGVVRVFSRDDARKAEPSVRQYYLDQTEKTRQAIANKASNGGNKVDPTKLPKIYEAQPGTSDGQVKMFNKEGVAWVFQWSDVSQTWVEVGEVMGDAKEELDGKEYDKVIPVEIEDPASGGIRSLKLGFNQGDNPWTVAQQFVETHGLSENHVQQIAEFVTNVRGQSNQVPTIDMSGGGSGFGMSESKTGGGGSEPMEVDMRSYPFPLASSTGGGGSEPMEVDMRSYPFPLASSTGLVFESVNLDKVFGKLKELNESSSSQLTEKELDALTELVATLKNTSRYHASTIEPSGLAALKKALTWDSKHVFPALDILRILLTHPDGSKKLCTGPSGQTVLLQVLNQASADGADLAVALLGARVLANCFAQRPGAEMVVNIFLEGKAMEISNALNELAGFPNKNVRSSIATALLNCGNALYHLAKSKVQDDIRSALMDTTLNLTSSCIEQSGEQESVRRCILAMGCLLAIAPLPNANADTISKIAQQIQGGGYDNNVADAANALQQYLKR